MRVKSLLLTFLMLILCSSQAFAFGSFGVRVGSGLAFDDGFKGDDLNPVPLAVGAGYQLDLVLLKLEADALYHRTSTDYFTLNQISVPVLAKFALPIPLPLLGLSLGAGVEPRFNLSASDRGQMEELDLESTSFYIPVMLGAQFNLGVLALNIEIRYEHQVSRLIKDHDSKINDLMFMGGVFF